MTVVSAVIVVAITIALVQLITDCLSTVRGARGLGKDAARADHLSGEPGITGYIGIGARRDVGKLPDYRWLLQRIHIDTVAVEDGIGLLAGYLRDIVSETDMAVPPIQAALYL